MTRMRGRRQPWRRSAAAVFAFAVLAVWAAPSPGQLAPKQAYDTSLPIEITADSLEVQQNPGVAVFRGNVDAVQGEMNLRADLLIVHYRKGGDGKNAISLIEAEGNVFLSSPSEMAQGDKGVYNIDASMIELNGSVVLTRGENVIRGNRLVMNLATGLSKIESGVAKAGKRERVKALFVPKSTKQKSTKQ